MAPTDIVVSFTFGQLIAGLLAICAGISCVALAISWIAKGIQVAQAPSKRQDNRLEALEQKTHNQLDMLANDKKRLDAIEKTQTMQLRATYALLDHTLDGNNVEAMHNSKEEIKKWLFER